MARLASIIAGILVVVSTVSVLANGNSPFSEWLGPQTNDHATPFAPVVGKPIDLARHDKLTRYEITVEIVKGRDLMLSASENAIVTFGETGFRQTKDFHAGKEATYLLCRMQLKKDQLGWRFYTLNARVTNGKLKGAIVHFRDGRIQKSITDPCVAIYRIPDDVNVATGKVPFEIVALFAK